MKTEPGTETTGRAREQGMQRARLVFFLIGCLIVLAGNWPVLSLANRIEPLVFGLPFLFIYVAAFIPGVMLFLYIAYRKGI
ncbi:MAG: hypothetical protein H0X67_05360 [Acidobacteria bacterium]|nr:hypothetical protein [Acidobacteriota bacterium]